MSSLEISADELEATNVTLNNQYVAFWSETH